MTRAKPKPTISTPEPAKKQRSEKVAPTQAAPQKPGPVTPRATKSSIANAVTITAAKSVPSKTASKAARLSTKAAPTKPVAKAANDAAPTKAIAKAAPAKAVASKGSSAKGIPAKPSAPLDTPAKLRPIEQAVGVSSDAVLRRTGKSWAEWFALLDAAGAAELDHKGIVAVLAQRHGVGPWWQQMVTVAYEQARGKNGNAASDDGFQVDVSKVLELPLAKLFRFWAEPAERNKWLADDRFAIHKATASKSIRARWGRGVSRIDVDFCEKGPSKSQVTVQHNRIETSDAAEQMKAYWAKKIRALEALTRP